MKNNKRYWLIRTVYEDSLNNLRSNMEYFISKIRFKQLRGPSLANRKEQWLITHRQFKNNLIECSLSRAKLHWIRSQQIIQIVKWTCLKVSCKINFLKFVIHFYRFMLNISNENFNFELDQTFLNFNFLILTYSVLFINII